MRPDDEALVPIDGIGADAELDALAGEMADAGRRARSGRREAPRAAFAADLRARLLADLPVVAPVTLAPEREDLDVWCRVPLTARPVGRRITVKAPTFLPSPRWSILAVAAAVLIAIAGLAPTYLLPGPAELRAGDVAGATLTRDGRTSALAPTEALRTGDIVTTDPHGFAFLELGTSRVNLDADTAVRLIDAAADRVDLEQMTGRAWHRVAGPQTTYTVRTADVTWTADGTAFDLRLETDPATGDDWVRAIGIEHQVAITSTDLTATLDEGGVARIRLRGGPGSVADVALGPITDADLADPWLLDNAALDRQLGVAVGVFEARLAQTDPTPQATPQPVDGPNASDVPVLDVPTPEPATGSPDPNPTATATPRPTEKATPRPTPTPKPTATPKPPLGSLGLSATACPGGFTRLAWTVAPPAGFDHYQSVRSSKTSIPAVYPPAAPGVAPDGLFAAERSTGAAVDAGLEPGATYSYRTMAFTADDLATAASPVRTVTAKTVAALGALGVARGGSGFTATWSAFSGPDGCFGFYKLVVSTTDTTPSYLTGATVVWVGESAATSSALVASLDPGTYHVRLQAYLDSPAGKLLVAETDVSDVTIP